MSRSELPTLPPSECPDEYLLQCVRARDAEALRMLEARVMRQASREDAQRWARGRMGQCG